MFSANFSFETKRLARKQFAITALLTSIITFTFLYFGVYEYEKAIESKNIFQKIEKERVENYNSWDTLGTYGIRFLLVPAPHSVLYAYSIPRNIVARINAGDQLLLYKDLKGRSIVADPSSYLDFSGLLLLIVPFISLLYGADWGRMKEHGKMVLFMASPNKIYFVQNFCRILILNIFLCFLLIFSLLMLLLFNINLMTVSTLKYIFLYCLLSVPFYFGGFLISSIKDLKKRLITLFAVYLIAISTPWLISQAVYLGSAELENTYELEKKKFDLMMDFENRTRQKIGTWEKEEGEVAPDKVLEVMKSGLRVEHKKIKEIEGKLQETIHQKFKLKKLLSLFFPTSAVKAISVELSGVSQQDIERFYQYVQDKKQDFLSYYVDNKFYKKSTKVIPFVKKTENLFYSLLGFSSAYWAGIVSMALYALLLAYFGLVRYKSGIFHIRVGAENVRDVKLHFPGEGLVFVDGPEPLQQTVARAFMKPIPGAAWLVQAPDIDFMEKPALVLPSPDSIPGEVFIKDFVQFFESAMGIQVIGLTAYYSEKFDVISRLEKQLILLSIASKIEASAYIMEGYLNYAECAHNDKGESPVFSKVWGLIQDLSANALTVLLREDSYWKQNKKAHFKIVEKKNKITNGRTEYELLGGEYMTMYQPGKEFLEAEGYKI